MTDEKHAGGRPTLYKSEYCDQVIGFLNEGMSIASIARELQVAKKTLYNWMEEHEEFLHAVKKGIDFSQGWWEEHGRKQLQNKDFNHVLWYMNMKNRFREDWIERQEVKTDSTADEANKAREIAHRCKTE